MLADACRSALTPGGTEEAADQSSSGEPPVKAANTASPPANTTARREQVRPAREQGEGGLEAVAERLHELRGRIELDEGRRESGT